MGSQESDRIVEIEYTNWRGDKGIRRIVPSTQGLQFASNEWHTENQWLLDAYDVDKGANRTFAVKDISRWTPQNPAG